MRRPSAAKRRRAGVPQTGGCRNRRWRRQAGSTEAGGMCNASSISPIFIVAHQEDVGQRGIRQSRDCEPLVVRHPGRPTAGSPQDSLQQDEGRKRKGGLQPRRASPKPAAFATVTPASMSAHARSRPARACFAPAGEPFYTCSTKPVANRKVASTDNKGAYARLTDSWKLRGGSAPVSGGLACTTT